MTKENNNIEYDQKTGERYVKNFRRGDFEFRSSFPLVRKWEEAKRYYEIVKWQKNPYYGNEKDYYTTDGGESYKKIGEENYGYTIHKSCFKNPESCYSIASYVYYEKEGDYDLKSVGSRIIISVEEYPDFKDVLEYGFENLNDLHKDNEDYEY